MAKEPEPMARTVRAFKFKTAADLLAQLEQLRGEGHDLAEVGLDAGSAELVERGGKVTLTFS